MDIRPSRGLTIIELLIATFIIGTVVVGLFGFFVLSLRSAAQGEKRLVALALANERAEMIRNLPYAKVGTAGGVPSGSIPQSETVTRQNLAYTVNTDIRYIDDSYDGTITSSPADMLNTDYKQVRVEVSWPSQTGSRPILLLLTIAPQGLEGGEAGGTLIFQAKDAEGGSVAGATVQVINTTTTPPVNLSTATDSQGTVVLPGLPPSSGTYKVAVTKSGSTSEQTYDQTATFVPDPDHAHLSILQGQVTPKTFLMDAVSSVTVLTQDASAVPLGGVAYRLRGTKTIGVDNNSQPVYRLDTMATTDAAGQHTHSGMVWDSYDLTVDGATTGYDIKETSYVLPLTVDPNQTLALAVTLVAHTPQSAHVTVVSATGLAVDNATVQLTGPGGYDQTLGTGVFGQVFFENLPAPGAYTVNISAPNFQPTTLPVTVSGYTRVRAELAPSS